MGREKNSGIPRLSCRRERCMGRWPIINALHILNLDMGSRCTHRGRGGRAEINALFALALGRGMLGLSPGFWIDRIGPVFWMDGITWLPSTTPNWSNRKSVQSGRSHLKRRRMGRAAAKSSVAALLLLCSSSSFGALLPLPPPAPAPSMCQSQRTQPTTAS